ncbi:hypothetical protein [Paraburkholderia aromaticivorans]|uniref:hypothetical protein n=1 Tax=Paraburkholderia aromaticivorans TaxID=2026199 RepID=UPI0038BDE27A
MSNKTFIFENDAGQTITIADEDGVEAKLRNTISSIEGPWRLYKLEDGKKIFLTPIKPYPSVHVAYTPRVKNNSTKPHKKRQSKNMFTGIDTSRYTVAQLAQMLGKKKATVASCLCTYGLPYVRAWPKH